MDRQINRQTGGQIDKIDKQTDRKMDRLMRQINRQTGGQIDKIDKQTDRWTDRQIDR